MAKADYGVVAGADPVARNATSGTPQEWIENTLVSLIEGFSPGYALRNNVAGWIELKSHIATRMVFLKT